MLEQEQPEGAIIPAQLNFAAAQYVGSQHMRAITAFRLGNIALRTGGVAESVQIFEEALKLFSNETDEVWVAGTLGNLGGAHLYLKQHDQAKARFEQALQVSRAISDRGREGQTLANLGNLYVETGDELKALQYYSQALPLLEEADNLISTTPS